MPKVLRVTVKTIALLALVIQVVLCGCSCAMSANREEAGPDGTPGSAAQGSAASDPSASGAAAPGEDGSAGSNTGADGAAAPGEPEDAQSWPIVFLGQELSPEETEVDFSSLTPAQVDEAASVLRRLDQVALIHLGEESGGLSWADLAELHAAAPAAVLDYGFSLWGVSSNLSAAELSFSHIPMDDEGAAVRAIVPLMVQLETLDMDTCNVSNEAMAVIRDENPSVNVIWRIWFARYSVRTDVERILASSTSRGGTVTDSEARALQYCTKVKYLDLGHNEELTDISFAACMPELEVAIFAINNIEDISPLANCPKLEYLEINSTNVTDLTPLSNATALRHLNIGRTSQSLYNTGGDNNRPRVSDLSPLFGLKDLERLWIGVETAPFIPQEQIDTMIEVMGVTDFWADAEGKVVSDPADAVQPYQYCTRINVTSGDPSQETWRYIGGQPELQWEHFLQTGVYEDIMNDRYKLLREQFGYDQAEQNYSLPQNDPLY